MRHRHGFSRLLLCLSALIFFAAALPANAQAATNAPAAAPRWTIPFLGFMPAPQGFTALDFEDWAKESDKLSGRDKKRPAPNPLLPSPAPLQMKFYQLAFNDGKAYHLAYALAFRDEKQEMLRLQPLTRGTDATKADALKTTHSELLTLLALMQSKITEADGFRFDVLNLTPITVMKNTPEPVLTISGRLIFNSRGVIIPAFIKAYLLEQNDRQVLIVLATSDSDAQLWSKLTDNMLRSLTKYQVSSLLTPQ